MSKEPSVSVPVTMGLGARVAAWLVVLCSAYIDAPSARAQACGCTFGTMQELRYSKTWGASWAEPWTVPDGYPEGLFDSIENREAALDHGVSEWRNLWLQSFSEVLLGQLDDDVRFSKDACSGYGCAVRIFSFPPAVLYANVRLKDPEPLYNDLGTRWRTDPVAAQGTAVGFVSMHGVLTHEFGHALGIKDHPTCPCPSDGIASLPTMVSYENWAACGGPGSEANGELATLEEWESCWLEQAYASVVSIQDDGQSDQAGLGPVDQPSFRAVRTNQGVVFTLPSQSTMGTEGKIEVIDVRGRRVAKIATSDVKREYTWNMLDSEGSRVGSGIYVALHSEGVRLINSTKVLVLH